MTFENGLQSKSANSSSTQIDVLNPHCREINQIDVNFQLQKSLDIFDKISADKTWSKKDKELKVSPLMGLKGVCSEHIHLYPGIGRFSMKSISKSGW